MWGFLIWWSLIATLVLALWRGNKWTALANTRHLDMHDGERYGYHEVRSKADVLRMLLLSFDVPAERFFRLRREGWFDRFGKGIRLVVEPEAGDPAYDKLFFLDSDDEALVSLLGKQKVLRTLLVSFLGRLERQKARLISMDAENGKLSLYIRVNLVSKPGQLREECVAWLNPLLQAIRNLPARHADPSRTSNVSSDIVRQVALALFAFGGYSVSWIWIMSSERLLEPSALAWSSAIFSAMALVALTLWALKHLGRASNRHRALAMWLFLSVMGIPFCSFTLIRAINISLDFAEHETIDVKNAELSTYHQRKSGPIHSVSYEFNDGSIHESDSLRIDWFEYRRLREAWKDKDAGPAIVHIHPGLLGFKWKEIVPQSIPADN